MTLLPHRGVPIWMCLLPIVVAAVTVSVVPRSAPTTPVAATADGIAGQHTERWLGTWMAASLPAQVRARHIGEIERAERWELALDGAIETWARIKATLATKFETLRSAH